MSLTLPDLALHDTLCFTSGWWPHHWFSGYFVGWGTLALLNAGLAQAKGRSGLFWFLGSLLAGPLATLLLVTVYAGGRRPSDNR